MKRSTVVIGFLGASLDQGPKDSKRWELWRPSVALCQQEDLLVKRFDLLYQMKYRTLAEQVRGDIANVSPETEVRLCQVELEDAWDFEEVYGALLDFTRAYTWNSEREEYLLHITTGTHVAQICMFLLAEARYFPASLLQTSPPTGPSTAAIGEYRIIDLDLSKYDSIASRFNKARREDLSFLKSGIETKNARFNRMIEQIERVAIASKEPMLLLGPTGAGKSRLARRIYELKKARNQVGGKFIDVNCATIRGDGAMSALFGHTKGAFTGAAGARDGLLLSAQGGVLFLDEIGELGADEQAMLLRAIEEKSFFPVGADKEVRSEFQLIAGTNRDLRAAAARGEFREDLLARINLWSFTLPGLRERPEDIPPNLDFELERYAARHGTRVTFNKEARQRFLDFAMSNDARWTSNFRDLGAAVVRMATLSDSGRIDVPVVEDELQRLALDWNVSGSTDDLTELSRHFGIREQLFAELDHFDRVQLIEVLKICKSSKTLSEAGRKLFAVSRKEKTNANDADRLRKYLARFGISSPTRTVLAS